MKFLKKMAKTYGFKAFVVIQILLITFFAILTPITCKKVSVEETQSLTVQKPQFIAYESYRKKVLKIKEGSKEFYVDNPLAARNLGITSDRAANKLKSEKEITFLYIKGMNSYQVVELKSDNQIYYTLDDYNYGKDKNIIYCIVLAVIIEGIYVTVLVLWINYGVLGKPIPWPNPKKLRKKYPKEKHVYTDTENDFSPYKQKLNEENEEE